LDEVRRLDDQAQCTAENHPRGVAGESAFGNSRRHGYGELAFRSDESLGNALDCLSIEKFRCGSSAIGRETEKSKGLHSHETQVRWIQDQIATPQAAWLDC